MISVLGSSGFIGSELVKQLRVNNIPFNIPARGEEMNERLGNIIYCIGLTADFRYKPFETVEAHVSLLNKLLDWGKFESLTYLSSTRVYINSKDSEVSENSLITVNINDPDELYTLTKLTGERICLSSGRKNVNIARLSNVYGEDYTSENFITSLLKQIKDDGHIRFFTTPDSAKDYISIEYVIDILLKIATSSKQGIYNIASGINITNAEIIQLLKEQFSFTYEFDAFAKKIIFPKINIDKIKNEFKFKNDSGTYLKQLLKNIKNDTN